MVPPGRRHRAQPGSPAAPAAPGTFFSFFTNPATFVPGENRPERSAPATGPAPRCRQGRAEPRRRGPLPCLSPVLVFLSLLRTVHGKRQFCCSRGRSAGWEGSGRQSLPACRDGSGASAAGGGCAQPGGGAAAVRAAQNWQQFRAEPFFFFPPFPPSPLPFLPPPSLSFPLSLLSLPFSLSLSCIHGWHSEPLCIYVHNTAARPLHFICIITISVQAHHIVCCLHLLLRLLSQSTRLDFHILNELILYQQHALTSQALGKRAPARRAPQPQPLPSLPLLPLIPRKVGWGEPLRRINYSYKLLLIVLIFFPSLMKEMLWESWIFFFPLTSLVFV